MRAVVTVDALGRRQYHSARLFLAIDNLLPTASLRD
jgi:hypothetical protein